MDQTPPVRVAVIPFMMLCIVSTTIGVLIGAGANPETKTDIFFFAAGGLMFGAVVSLWPDSGIVFQLLRVFLPTRYQEYENDMLGVLPPKQDNDVEPPVILVSIPERGITLRLSRCGIALRDWMEIAKTAQTGIYNQTLFERVFGREEEIGRTKYQEVSPLLAAEELGILKQSGNGYKVTEYEGREFFEHLAKGDWRALEKLPKDSVQI